MKKLMFLTLVVMLCLGSHARAEGDWNELDPPIAPSARQGHSMVTLPDGGIVMFGGVSDGAVSGATLAGTLAAMADNTGTDPAHKYAWGENVGWANAGPTNHQVAVHYYEGTGGWLSGHAWGENIGWIVMGSAGGGPYANTTSNNWGVNLAANGDFSGYAWGENVGWINFEQTHGQPAINPANGEFSGHAWGENIGWLKFKGTSPDYGVRSMAFYTQPWARRTGGWALTV